MLLSFTFHFDITYNNFKSKSKITTNYGGLLKNPELYYNIRFPFKFFDKLVKKRNINCSHVLKFTRPFFGNWMLKGACSL